MTAELTLLKDRLKQEELTCILQTEQERFISRERGVKPLLLALDSKKNFSGALAADRVVGNGAAFLYVLLNVRELYTSVISRPALQTLQTAGISVEYDLLTDKIRNRAGDGFCPIETAVEGEHDPQSALQKIRLKLKELQA